MRDLIKQAYTYRNNRGEFRTGYRAAGISELTDTHLINALRKMENDNPERAVHDDYVGLADVGYIETIEDIVDPHKLRNYEDYKIEAETRGLTWRVV